MLSLVEVPVAYMTEEKGISRTVAVLINGFIIFAIGILATLSADKASLLGDVTFMGRGFFDWFDYLSSNILMPLGGLLIILFMSYVVDKNSIKEELTNNGTLNLGAFLSFFFIVIRYVTPALLIVIFLNAVGVLKI